MDEIKKNFPDAHNWLADKPQQQWSRSHFCTLPKCGILLNNLCKSFNRYILEARARPILTLVEMVRCKLMNRFFVKRSVLEHYEGRLCPRIQKKLERNISLANRYWPQPSTRKIFQVKAPGSMYTVDLEERSCSCRKWDLSGIPCPHAIGAIHYCHQSAEEYVEECYLVETQRKIYMEAIKPINGESQWPEDEFRPLPPQVPTTKAGRPSAKRRKEADEVHQSSSRSSKIPRSGVVITCRKCGDQGHNVRTCQQRAKASPPGHAETPPTAGHAETVPPDGTSQSSFRSQSNTAPTPTPTEIAPKVAPSTMLNQGEMTPQSTLQSPTKERVKRTAGRQLSFHPSFVTPVASASPKKSICRHKRVYKGEEVRTRGAAE